MLCAARVRTTELALVADTLTDPKQLLRRPLDGRRDGRKCLHCIQAGMRERRTFRRSGLDPHSEPHVHEYAIDSDSSDPHEPDVDADVQAYVGCRDGAPVWLCRSTGE